jgi:hypothetical protein
MIERVLKAAYLACYISDPVNVCLRDRAPVDRGEWTLSFTVPEYKPRP